MQITKKDIIINLKNKGWSWEVIGNYFGISRARAHQIGSGYNSGSKYIGEVLERDNFECQLKIKCEGGKNREDLVVHHFDGNDRNNDANNVITVCRKCHHSLHFKSGFKHTTLLKKCNNCGELKIRQCDKKRKFCSPKCRINFYNKKWQKQCSNCGKIFIISKNTRFNYYRDYSKFNRKSYCSLDCYNKRLNININP